MTSYWESLQDVLIDRSPAELIGAIAFALALALVVTGVYELGVRRVKDGTVLMTALVVVACVVSMAFASGYVARSRRPTRRGPRPPVAPPVWVPLVGQVEHHLAQRILDLADANRDGVLSSEEASEAAGQFTREAERRKNGPIAADALVEALRGAGLTPPPFGPAAVGTPPPGIEPPGPRLGDRRDRTD